MKKDNFLNQIHLKNPHSRRPSRFLKGFTPLEKVADFSRWLLPFKADGGLKPSPAQIDRPIRKELSNGVKKRSSLTGFTLVEIMIVVAIIMILSFLLIPSMLRSSITANESSAIANLRNIYTVSQMYYVDNAREYPQQLSDLSDYISPALASGSKSGYLFVYSRDSEDEFHINSNPRTPGRTGVRYFYLDETNVIRYNSSGEASESDPIAE